MAWTDQCKIHFKSTAHHKLYSQDPGTKKDGTPKRRPKKMLKDVLKEISVETEIPVKTLERWWYEEEPLKSEGNLQESDIVGESGVNVQSVQGVMCIKCEVRALYADPQTGKPPGLATLYGGLCGACRKGKQRERKKGRQKCTQCEGGWIYTK